MADNALPDPAELIGARALLAPEIRGLTDIRNDDISSALADVLDRVLSDRSRREGLIGAALIARDAYIAALQALTDDGYPALPPVTIPAELLAEVKAEEADIESAVAIFATQMAAEAKITLGKPVPKV